MDCKHENTIFIETPESPHYGKDVCEDCGRHVRWVAKPDNEKIKRPSAHKNLVAKYSNGYCEMCLLPEDMLPSGQTLEAQHVIEYADGGGDGRDNIWIICTKCHKLIHWIRHWAGYSI